MRGFSKAIIAGNLTRDPEMRTTPSGAQVCSFSVAVNRNYKDSKGSMQESVSFFDCVAWGRNAETINQYMKKGNAILVSGRAEQQNWTDKEGHKRTSFEITVEEATFLGGQQDGTSAYGGGSSYDSNRYAGDASSAQSAPASAAAAGSAVGPAAAPAQGDEGQMPQEIPDEPIDLSEIPF